MKEPSFELLFPTPIMFTEMDRSFTQDELDFVAKHGKEEMTNRNVGNVTSNNNYILEEPEMADLKNIITESINEYANIYPDVDVFLPIVKDINTEGKFVSFTNESAWAYGFSDRQGFIDNELLLDFQNYQISGGLYRTQVIKDRSEEHTSELQSH